MAELKIRIYGDPVLRRKALPVGEVTPEVRELVEDMIDTMYRAPGIGLAAPQVGELKRLFVIDPTFGDSEGEAFGLIDPVLTLDRGEDAVIEEGCLSIPEVRAEVTRPKRITVEYTTIDGVRTELDADDMLSRVIQHEYDHLDGILFVDRMSPLKRRLLDKDLKALARSRKRTRVPA